MPLGARSQASGARGWWGFRDRHGFLSGFHAKHGAGMLGSIWPWPWVSEAVWRLSTDTRSLSQQHRAEPALAIAFTSSSAALCCGIRAMGMESPGPIPASQQKESPLVSGACSIYTAYRGGFCLPRHWKMLHMGGQPHQSLFLLSLVRQGCIKMVFALLDAQNNSFAQGVRWRAVISLLPPWSWSSFKGWFLAPEVTAQAEPGCLLSWVCALVTS